jgi:hypothetical protein
MNQPEEETDDAQQVTGKSPWERPTLTELGKVKDLVKGQGKQGSRADHDPSETRKVGTG